MDNTFLEDTMINLQHRGITTTDLANALEHFVNEDKKRREVQDNLRITNPQTVERD